MTDNIRTSLEWFKYIQKVECQEISVIKDEIRDTHKISDYSNQCP